MNIYQLLFRYYVLIFIWIIIFIIQTNLPFLIIIVIITRLFFNFIITLGDNYIGDEGAKSLAEALKYNKNLTSINLSKIWHLSLLEIISIMHIYQFLFTD